MADKNGDPAPKTSKMEAVRQALGELGKDVTSLAIQAFAKDRFGLDVPPDLAKKYKSEILRKGTKKGKKKLTKQEAVRRALAELGNDAKPTVIQGFVKERFRLDMGTDHISTAKGDILRQAAGKDKPTTPAPAVSAPPAKKEPVAPGARAAALPGADNGTAIIGLDDIRTTKSLVERVGTEQLRRLIDVLAK